MSSISDLETHWKPTPADLNICVEKPKFPNYALLSKRLDSFDNWPFGYLVKPLDLAEAGLVYSGTGDFVRCYFCGGGIRNWERDDVPMEVHAKWYPKCPHVLLLEGPDYVRNKVSEPESDSKSEDQLLSVAAQSCLFVGFPNTIVRNAIQIFRDKFEREDYTGKDLCEILLELEDDADDRNVADKVEDLSSLEDEVDGDRKENSKPRRRDVIR